MNTKKIVLLTVLAAALTTFALQGCSINPQAKEPWTNQQLMGPSDLAKVLNDSKSPQPIVYCIGPQAIIKNSILIGSTQSKANLNKLKQELDKLPRDANVVIYCGCCPFAVCPNIRPAFALLNEMKFKNHKLLNLPRNIKVDWIDHDYPVSY
jgi:thiosulfate/3-mercaptopyruvate sulfurtransferase